MFFCTENRRGDFHVAAMPSVLLEENKDFTGLPLLVELVIHSADACRDCKE